MNRTNKFPAENLHLAMLRWVPVAVFVFVFCLAPVLSKGQQVLFSEDFESGTGGWTVVNWPGDGTPAQPSWAAGGGNPNGFIACTDVQGDGFWRAPSTFHGDWSAAYGGILQFDRRASLNDWVMNDVYLVGVETNLTFKLPSNPTAAWERCVIVLDENAGWQVGRYYTETGPMATRAQIVQVLANVTDLRIRQEYAWGDDDSALDNVAVFARTGTPIQPTLVASTTGSFLHLYVNNLTIGSNWTIQHRSTLAASDDWATAFSFQATNTVQHFDLLRTELSRLYRARSN